MGRGRRRYKAAECNNCGHIQRVHQRMPNRRHTGECLAPKPLENGDLAICDCPGFEEKKK